MSPQVLPSFASGGTYDAKECDLDTTFFTGDVPAGAQIKATTGLGLFSYDHTTAVTVLHPKVVPRQDVSELSLKRDRRDAKAFYDADRDALYKLEQHLKDPESKPPGLKDVPGEQAGRPGREALQLARQRLERSWAVLSGIEESLKEIRNARVAAGPTGDKFELEENLKSQQWFRDKAAEEYEGLRRLLADERVKRGTGTDSSDHGAGLEKLAHDVDRARKTLEDHQEQMEEINAKLNVKRKS
jgi:hypothetical protein